MFSQPSQWIQLSTMTFCDRPSRSFSHLLCQTTLGALPFLEILDRGLCTRCHHFLRHLCDSQFLLLFPERSFSQEFLLICTLNFPSALPSQPLPPAKHLFTGNRNYYLLTYLSVIYKFLIFLTRD